FQEPSSAAWSPRTAGGSSEIVILDADGVIVVVNQAWRATVAAYGFVLRNAGIGTSYVDVACRFLPDLDRAALEHSLQRLLSGLVEEVRHTYAIPTAGGPSWRHVQITPLSMGTAGRFVAIHDDLTELALAQEALKVTSEQLLNARDEERQRIALELHDSTLQHLAAINFGLARLRRASPGKLATTILDTIATSLNEAVKETRVLSYLMKPRGLAGDGLAATVRQFLEGFAQRTGLQVTLEADVAVDGAPLPLQHAALRIVQEALMNANRHAQAERVSVELAVDKGLLTVSVADDGRGMTTADGDPCLGVGIPGMHARAEQLSGQLEILSDARGTRVEAWLPLA
ncbi:MAG: PAS domain-containing sensor histidine kinase, partial [Phenylobacterium sp.]